MSRLQELIAELCPDGVEYRHIGDLCLIKARIGWQRLSKAEYLDEGDYYLVTGVDMLPNHTIDFDKCHYVSKERYEMDTNIQLIRDDIIVSKDGTIGKVAIIDGLNKPAVLNSHLFVVRICDAAVLYPRFLMHVLTSGLFTEFVNRRQTGSTRKGLNQKVMVEFRIPVPPIEVQREVVRVLDEYTAAHDELVRLLEEEMRLSEQQLSIARNELLTFSERERVRWMALGEVCRVGRGTYITGKKVIPGNIPVILGGMEPAYYHNVSNHEGEAIVVSRSGVNAGYTSFWDEPIFVSDGFVVDSPAKDVSLQYVFEVMKARQQEMIGMNRGSGVPHITGKMLSSLIIPLPDFDAQEKLVETLGNLSMRFDEFCAELEFERDLRDVGQALVRNQLLSFPEKVA